MKPTVGKLRTARRIAEVFKTRKSKFGYACSKAVTNINTVLKKDDEELEDKRHELASVDDKGNIILTDKGFQYTKENYKKLIDFIKQQELKEVEYTPYIATSFKEVENDISILEALDGIVVNFDIDTFYKEEVEG